MTTPPLVEVKGFVSVDDLPVSEDQSASNIRLVWKDYAIRLLSNNNPSVVQTIRDRCPLEGTHTTTESNLHYVIVKWHFAFASSAYRLVKPERKRTENYNEKFADEQNLIERSLLLHQRWTLVPAWFGLLICQNDLSKRHLWVSRIQTPRQKRHLAAHKRFIDFSLPSFPLQA
jgi:hypothetical protein